jgi:TrbL/VirB6 plasmid conjugal transfer protein
VNRLRLLAAFTVGLVLVAWPPAGAKYRGSDVLGNLSPESLLGADSLANRYPLAAYSLDYHTDVGITDLDGVPATIAHWAAAQLWSLTSFLVKTVIDLFSWAFSLDLLAGDPNRPDDGALGPVSSAISSLYENVIGEAWVVAAIILAGIWGIWKALVQRRYTETAGALAVSVLFVLIALFFVYQPERTIGQASKWTNTLSLAFLSGANRGTIDDPGQAKRQVADQLFAAQIYQPWVALQFGGLRHCVDTNRTDEDGFPRPVGPHDKTADVCRDHLRAGRDGHGGYAPRFLRHAPGSEERNAEYEALKNGEAPDDDPQFAGYPVDKADAPAVDIQQAGGAFQRLTLALVIFVGALGMICLLGFLALAMILAQIVALVLLGFAPVALVIGILPRGGHEFFRNWLGKLATAIFIKALYSLVIAIVVAVSAALASATESLGFLFAFALQAIFYWAIFLYRKQIAARLVTATTGARQDGERLPRMTAVQRGASIATHPFGALLAIPRRGNDRRDERQESALAGGGPAHGANGTGTLDLDGRPGGEQPTAPHASANGHRAPVVSDDEAPERPNGDAATRDTGSAAGPRVVTHRGAGLSAEASSAPPHQGGSSGDSVGARANGSARDATPAAPEAEGASPRATHEDVMQRARELRERQRAHDDRER